jgi:hypothetical protein
MKVMPRLSDRVENVLNEIRILLLGGQVLLGFSYRPYFEESFEALPFRAQMVHTIGVGVLTLGLIWLLSEAPFHQIVEHGEDTERTHRVATLILDWGLLPFAVGLGFYGYVISTLMGFHQPALIGISTTLFSFTWWYFFPLSRYDARRRSRVISELREEQRKQGGTEIKEKIKKLLMECRMVLPGVQALLGFQLTTFFMQGFERLPQSSKFIHCGGLVATAISTVLVITPAAYHRIAEAGEETERFHRIGTRLLLVSMFFLGLALCADFVVVIRKMGLTLTWSITVGILLLLFSYTLWFGSALVRPQSR